MTKKAKSGRKKLSINRGSVRKLSESESEGAAGGLPIAGGRTGGCVPTNTCQTCNTGCNTCACPGSAAGCAG